MFAGPTTIRPGPGLDQVRLGTDNTAASGVYFEVKPTLDGGKWTQDGLAALDYFLQTQNGPMGATRWEL